MGQVFGYRTVEPRILFHCDPTQSVDWTVTGEIRDRIGPNAKWEVSECES